MSWMDEELDELFREQAADHSVPYKNDYWKEFEAEHLDKRRGEGIWLMTSIFFAGCLLVGALLPELGTDVSEISNTNSNNRIDVAQSEKLNTLSSSTHDETLKSDHSNRQSENQKLNGVKEGHDSDELLQIQVSSRFSPNEVVVDQNIENAQISVDDRSELNQEVQFEELDQTIVLEESAALNYKDAGLQEVLVNNQLEILKPYSVPRHVRMYMEGTMGITQSMIKNDGLVSHNYGAGIGAKFNYGRFVATAGFNGMIANHNDMLLTRSSKIYGFGSNEYKADIDYAQLYQAGLNISVGTKIGRTTVSLGYGVNYLVATKSYVYQYTVDSQNPDESVYKRNTYLNYMDGLNRVTSTVVFGVTHEFSPGVEMGLNLGLQLNNNFDMTVTTELNRTPIKGQLFIRKTF